MKDITINYCNYLYYEGDEGEGAPPPSEGEKPKFTEEQQKHINTILASEKRKYQEQVKTLETQLGNAKLTKEQRDTLATQLEEMKASLRTKEEQAEYEKNQLIKKHQTDIEAATTDSKKWKERYERSTIQRSLMDAAIAGDAFSPNQIVSILQGNTRLVQKVNDKGEPMDDFEVKVKISLPDNKGQMQELDLSPQDAVKRMSEASDLYGNLFKSNIKGGMGDSGTGKKTKSDLKSLANDPKAYRDARKKGEIPALKG
jgi:hypothetical protein